MKKYYISTQLKLEISIMKKRVLLLICMFTVSFSFAQNEIKSAKEGVEYGVGVKAEKGISVMELERALIADSLFLGSVKGKVVEVCVKKGCFMKIGREEGLDPVMVRFKDYAFFMPQDMVGKNVIVEGEAKVKETSVAQLQHFAEDAGKSAEEIAKIKVSRTDVEITATGVKVL